MSPAPLSLAQPAPMLANVELEAALLGGLLALNSPIAEVAPLLQPCDFAEPVHGRIFAAVIRRHEAGQSASPVSLRPEFEGDEGLASLGGAVYLAKLSGLPSTAWAGPDSAREIADLAARRRLVEELREAERLAADPATPLAELRLPELPALHKQRAPLSYEWAGNVVPVFDGFWLIEGFLPRSGPATIFGHPGSGKTFLALDIAASVAEGRPWAGREVSGGPVLYVVAEGLSGFQNRLHAMIEAGRLSRGPPFAFVPTAIDLQCPTGDTQSLIVTLEHFAAKAGRPPALIVIDTLSKTFGAGKENTDDMAAYVANCERIATAFDCLVLIVHHRPRNGDNERGHSSLRGGVVAAILVEGDGIKTAISVKQKDGPDGERIAFHLDPVVIGHDSRGREVSTCLVEIVEGDAVNDRQSGTGKRRLSGQKKIAFDALETEIALHGIYPPDTISRKNLDRAKVFKVIGSGQAADKLKAEFLATVGGHPDKRADTARRTAHRTISDLKAAGILGTWEDWLWIN